MLGKQNGVLAGEMGGETPGHSYINTHISSRFGKKPGVLHRAAVWRVVVCVWVGVRCAVW